jgi:hypothetical protein
MQQLYAYGSIARNESDRTPAPGSTLRLPTVKATTAGVTPDRLQVVLPHAMYNGGKSVRLALLNTANGRVLTHAVPAGESYFAHTLLNVPETADAQLAIQTWGSPQWQRSSPDQVGDLPELPHLPVADLLDDPSLKSWLETPYKRELLEFTLTALLATTGENRVFLAATVDDVAKVIYAVTRALPANLLETFTFSTHEADPVASTAKLVGCDCGDDADLPESCYRIGAGFNAYTGKRSDLTANVPFAKFAAAALADGTLSKLEDLKSTWQRIGLTDARRFDLVYRLMDGTAPLTQTETTEAVQNPGLAAWLATRPAALDQLLEWALEDRAYANTTFARVVQPLRQTPSVLAKLAAKVRDVGFEAVTAGDTARTTNSFEVVLPMVAPAKANAAWGELLNRVTSPDQLSWEMRWYLLPRLVRFKQQQQTTSSVDPIFTKWLDLPTDRLAQLLSLDVPKAYHLEGCRACLKREGEPSPATAMTLSQHPTLALALLQPADSESASLKLYESLLKHSPTRPWFEDVIGAASDYPPALLNQFFEATLSTETLDADRLIRTRGDQLLKLFAGQSGLNKLGTQFLAKPPADALHNTTTCSFLNQLQEQDGLSDELKSRIGAVQAVRAFVNDPRLTSEAIAPVTAAFALSSSPLPTTAKSDLFNAVSLKIANSIDSAELQTDLETVLVLFGDTLATGSTDLYENLLREVRTKSVEFGRNANVVHAFLAIALGAAENKELASKLDGLDGHAFSVASNAAHRGGNRLLNEIESKAINWPKEARGKWGFLLAAVRPKVRWQRDLVCGLIGAAVAAVLLLAVRFLT